MSYVPKAIWKRLSSCPTGRSSHSVSITSKGQLLIYGGELLPRTPIDNSQQVPAGSVHSLNLSQTLTARDGGGQGWITLRPEPIGATQPRIPEARVGATTAWNDTTERLYLWGGRGGTSMDPFPSDQCGIWEGHADGNDIHWMRISAENESEAPESRSYHTLVSFKDKLYFHAGCPSSGRLETLHSFDVLTKRWQRLQDAPLPGRGGTALALVTKGDDAEAIILRFGGFAGYELPKPLAHDLDIYNIASNTWITVTPAADPDHGHPGPRSVHGFAPFTSKIPGPADAVAVLFHGERDASSLGHAGAGTFWDDIWILSHTGPLTNIQKDSTGGFSWKKATVQGSDVPEGRGWFPDASFASSTGNSMIVMVGGLLGNNERSDETWLLNVA